MSQQTNGVATNSGPKAAFNKAVDDTLERAIKISNQRGGEYADSWALENQQTRFLDMVLTEIASNAGGTVAISSRAKAAAFTTEEKRLIMVACLCDVKVSRLLGGYKDDTLDDLINYVAALRGWMTDYLDHVQQTPQASAVVQ